MPKQHRARKALEFPESQPHRVRHSRPHIAQELKDLGRTELAAELTCRLRPHFAMCAEGRVTYGFVVKKQRKDQLIAEQVAAA